MNDSWLVLLMLKLHSVHCKETEHPNCPFLSFFIWIEDLDCSWKLNVINLSILPINAGTWSKVDTWVTTECQNLCVIFIQYPMQKRLHRILYVSLWPSMGSLSPQLFWTWLYLTSIFFPCIMSGGSSCEILCSFHIKLWYCCAWKFRNNRV